MARTMQVKGSTDVMKTLNAMAKSLGAPVVRKHIRSGARILAKRAQANASHADVTGQTSKSIGVINDPKDKVGVITGPRRGKQFPGGFVAHILEYGAAPHIIAPKKKGKKKVLKTASGGFAKEVDHPGVQATPFMRPAWDTTQTTVLDKIKQGLKAEISDFGGKYKKVRMR